MEGNRGLTCVAPDKESQVKEFYGTCKWKRKRLWILRRDGYKCQDAKRYGKYEEATTVHHIYPLEDYPELALMNWNLISLSGSRHGRMHDKVTGKITDEGLYWQRKHRTEFEEWLARHPPTNGFEN